jgi:hypothetical protein
MLLTGIRTDTKIRELLCVDQLLLRFSVSACVRSTGNFVYRFIRMNSFVHWTDFSNVGGSAGGTACPEQGQPRQTKSARGHIPHPLVTHPLTRWRINGCIRTVLLGTLNMWQADQLLWVDSFPAEAALKLHDAKR